MKNNSIRTVVATGIGAALFIIIGMFVNIPIFGNTSIQSVCCSSPILSDFWAYYRFLYGLHWPCA